MDIGIIGSGNMGASMGKIWAANGHKVLFSFSKDQDKLREVAAAGPNARTGTPAEAVAFGELILFSVPWRWLSLSPALNWRGLLLGKAYPKHKTTGRFDSDPGHHSPTSS